MEKILPKIKRFNLSSGVYIITDEKKDILYSLLNKAMYIPQVSDALNSVAEL